MKRITVILAFLMFGIFCNQYSKGQGALQITSMTNFPALPNDTAYEGQLYNFSVTVSNSALITIQGPISLNMMTDSSSMIFGTIGNPVLAGGIVTQQINGFSFTQPFFKTGNNIVVVWPSVNSTTIQIDTFYADVFFVPLLSTIENPEKSNITIYPNPTTDFIFFDIPTNTAIIEVMLFDELGREIRSVSLKGNSIDVRNLSSGNYFIRLRSVRNEWYMRVIIE